METIYETPWETRWLTDGQTHRGDDLPAVIFSNGKQEWWWHGKVHRDGDLPAVVHADGSQEWMVHGQRYRGNNKPVVVLANGVQEWLDNGKRVVKQVTDFHDAGLRVAWTKATVACNNLQRATVQARRAAAFPTLHRFITCDDGLPYHVVDEYALLVALFL